MPDEPKLPPKPDALRKPQPAAVPPKRRTLSRTHDPFNAPAKRQPQASQPDAAEVEEKSKERQASGLGEMDTPHVFAGVFASGIGRAVAVLLTCMLAFGLTEACHLVSQIFAGQQGPGIKGFFLSLAAVPVAPFASPSRFYQAMSWNIGETLLGPPYLMLFIGGLVLAVRSEIHILKLCFFYFIVGSIHAVAYLKMTNVISFMLWAGMLFSGVWLYRWYWKQQESGETEEQDEEDEVDEQQPPEVRG